MQMFKVPCWATLGNERFGLATIPDSVRQLYLFVDNDAGGRLAEERAREAYACEGRLIISRRPELAGDDWNDVLMRSRSEEHTSELQSLMRNSYAVFCLKKKK